MPCTTSLLTEVHKSAWKTVIALEGRLDAKFGQPRYRGLFKIECGGARLHLAAHQLEHFADTSPARRIFSIS